MHKSFVANFGLVVVKVLGGVWFKSTALIADGVHSLSDLLSDIFVIVGIRHSAKPPDKEHPVGHGKFQYILSLFIGISILFLAYQLIIRAVDTISAEPEIPSIYGLIVVALVVTTKLALSRYILSRGKRYDSSVLTASGTESLTDVISSVVVLVGIVLSVLGGHFDIAWLRYGDTAAALLIAALIIRIGVLIIYDAVQYLMGKQAPESVLKNTRECVKNIKGVRGIDNLEMISYGHYYQVIIDIRVDSTISVAQGHDIASAVKRALKEDKRISHVTVHVNPEVE